MVYYGRAGLFGRTGRIFYRPGARAASDSFVAASASAGAALACSDVRPGRSASNRRSSSPGSPGPSNPRSAAPLDSAQGRPSGQTFLRVSTRGRRWPARRSARRPGDTVLRRRDLAVAGPLLETLGKNGIVKVSGGGGRIRAIVGADGEAGDRGMRGGRFWKVGFGAVIVAGAFALGQWSRPVPTSSPQPENEPVGFRPAEVDLG